MGKVLGGFFLDFFENWPITGTSWAFLFHSYLCFFCFVFLHMNIYVNIYDKYIYFKSYHDFMFVFCSLFIGEQKKKKKMTLKCVHYVHA